MMPYRFARKPRNQMRLQRLYWGFHCKVLYNLMMFNSAFKSQLKLFFKNTAGHETTAIHP